MGQPAAQLYTIPEYLALEARTGIKHEYHAGVVTAMAGGTPEHARVTLRAGFLLEQHLKGKPCKPFSSDLKVKAGGKTFYPDVSVVCPPVRRDDEMTDAITNPRVIIEVLSESTENYDRVEKFAFYRENPELIDYVLISPTRRYAEHYSREANGSWNLEFLGGDSTLRLASIECEIPVAEFYEGLELLVP